MAKTSLAKIIEEEVAGFKEQVKLVEGGYRSKYSLVLSENLLAHIMPKMDTTISDEDAKKNAGYPFATVSHADALVLNNNPEGD